MMSGDKLWVGTGGGRVLILTFAPNVPDVSEALCVLVKRKMAVDAEITASPRSVDSKALLAPTTDTKPPDSTPQTPEQEKWVHVEEGGSSPTPTHYKNRRHTLFGKALRNKSQKTLRVKDSQDDIYSLQFLACSDVVTAANDPVRILIPLRSVTMCLDIPQVSDNVS